MSQSPNAEQLLTNNWSAWHEIEDPDGTVWVPTSFVQPIESTPERRQEAAEKAAPGRDFADLTFSEAVEAFRPVMEFDGVVYTVRDDDARRLVQRMLDARGKELSDPGSIDGGEDVPDDVEPKRIFWPENRAAVSAPASFPHNLHADIYISTPDSPSCTGFKWINHYTGTTAAHCVHNGVGTGTWFDRDAWAFGYSNYVSPYDHVDRYCYARTVPSCWAVNAQMSCDYAVIRFRANGTNCYGPSYNHGYLGYSTYSGNSGLAVTVAGYPGIGPFNLPSGVLYSGSGTTTAQLSWTGTWLEHNVDTTTGQSGAPVLSGGSYVRAVNRGVNPIPSQPNNGRAVSSELLTWFQANAGY